MSDDLTRQEPRSMDLPSDDMDARLDVDRADVDVARTNDQEVDADSDVDTGGAPMLREGADALDAADIEDPATQL